MLAGGPGGSPGVHQAASGRLAGWAGGSSRALIRSSIPARSAAGNFQLNGRAVWLYRPVKASRGAESWGVLAKWFGETTLFFTMEKIPSCVRQDAWTGVWIMLAFGRAARSRRAAFLPRWSEPLSTMTNTRGALR